MSDVIDRYRTTMSDSDVIHQVGPLQDSCGRMSDGDWVAVSKSIPADFWEPTYEWPSQLFASRKRFALRQLERQLLSITDNWDGYHAKAPNTEAIETTLTLLDSLLPVVPFPDVFPSTEGGVILEWESSDAEVLLVIESANKMETTVDLEGSRFEGPIDSVRSELAAALHRISSSA